MKYSIVFSEPTPGGRVEYVLGGPDKALLEKTRYEGNRAVTRVEYFNYHRRNGVLEPHGVVLRSLKYSYRLLIRVKDPSSPRPEGQENP